MFSLLQFQEIRKKSKTAGIILTQIILNSKNNNVETISEVETSLNGQGWKLLKPT